MIRFCRRNISKVYSAFVVITTLLIASDLILVSTRSTILKIGKMDHLVGQEQTKLKQVNKTVFVKIKDARVYLLSGIIVYNATNNNLRKSPSNQQSRPTVIMSGWESVNHSESDFNCCFILKDGSLVTEKSSSKSHWWLPIKTMLRAKQFKCPIRRDVSEIEMVSITYKNATCPTERSFFIQPTALKEKLKDEKKNSSKIAVCIKISFGSLDARKLIEWFEVHRLFGVDKVITYRYNLNAMARRVLDFYEKIGMAEVYDFDLPEKYIVKRDIGVKNVQGWNDEQIVLFDCQERLRNYDYVAIVDSDEFIIPSSSNFVNAWRIFMDKKFRGTNFAGFFFSVQVHAHTWGPTKTNHPLHIGRYNNCTLPMFDRVKGIYMPSRVQQGTVSTHTFTPLTGYKKGYIRPKEAVIHHFRECRKEWLKQRRGDYFQNRRYLYNGKNRTECYDLKRTPSKIMEKLSNTVKARVLDRFQEIGV